MVDEYVFLFHDQQQLAVVNILNGSTVWNQQFNNQGVGLRFTPALDENSNSTLRAQIFSSYK